MTFPQTVTQVYLMRSSQEIEDFRTDSSIERVPQHIHYNANIKLWARMTENDLGITKGFESVTNAW